MAKSKWILIFVMLALFVCSLWVCYFINLHGFDSRSLYGDTLSDLELELLLKSARNNFKPKHYERRAVDIASTMIYNENISSRNSVLCCVFLALSSTAIKRLVQNVKNIGTDCKWAFVIYKYNETTKQDDIKSFSSETLMMSNLNYQFIFAPPQIQFLTYTVNICTEMNKKPEYQKFKLLEICDSINDTAVAQHVLLYNTKVYPKALLFLMVLPLIQDHKFIWILDSDLSFEGFKLDKYMEILQCGFANTAMPPLVSQPLIAENTQTYKFLNKKQWLNSKAIAVQTGFIEIQAPMLHADYFQWYLLSFVLPMVVPSYILGADWGFDQLFCSSAQLYYHHASLQLSNNKTTPLYRNDPINATTFMASNITTDNHAFFSPAESVVCTVITDPSSNAIHHNNNKETNELLGYNAKKALNIEMIRYIHESFPRFALSGKSHLTDPLLSNTALRTISKLRKGHCLS